MEFAGAAYRTGMFPTENAKMRTYSSVQVQVGFSPTPRQISSVQPCPVITITVVAIWFSAYCHTMHETNWRGLTCRHTSQAPLTGNKLGPPTCFSD